MAIYKGLKENIKEKLSALLSTHIHPIAEHRLLYIEGKSHSQSFTIPIGDYKEICAPLPSSFPHVSLHRSSN